MIRLRTNAIYEANADDRELPGIKIMRPLLIAVAAFLVAAPARAESVWTAPGWYQIADTIVGPFVWRGPFADQGACEAGLPPNEEDADYVCEYLTEQPGWDF